MPPRKTKQEIIDELEARLEVLRGDHVVAQEALEEAVRLNDRLNQTLKKEREKIGKLKAVARFYRAQRDRVDAYLSAVIDSNEGAENRKDQPYATNAYETCDTVGVAKEAMPPCSEPYGGRPRVQEPGEAHFIDGRSYTTYRDNEPVESWEDF